MFVKGISTEDFLVNHVGRLSNNSRRRDPMNCFGGLANRFSSEGCPIFYRHSIVCFQEQIAFVLKIDYFTRIRLRHM